MKKLLAALLIMLQIMGLAACDPAPSPQKDAELIKSYVETLCSDEFDGRLSGTKGNELAADWLAAKLDEFGLEPFDTGGYKLPFLSTWHDFKSSYMTVNFGEVTKELVLGRDYFHMIKNVPETTILFEDGGFLFQDVYDLGAAKKSGCAYIFEKTSSFFNGPGDLGSSDFVRMQFSSDIYDELKAGFVSIKFKHEVIYGEKELNNVAGLIKGSASDHCLYITAHFDHMGRQGEALFAGALDNASGTAAVLYLAEKLKKQAEASPFPFDIAIVFFDREESSLLGSEAFVADYAGRYKTKTNINLDCIGSVEGNVYPVGCPQAPELAQDMAVFLRQHNLAVDDSAQHASDHLSFKSADIPVFGLQRLHTTSIIHQPGDLPDRLNYENILAAATAVYDFTLAKGGVAYAVHEETHDDNKITVIETPEAKVFEEFLEVVRALFMGEAVELGDRFTPYSFGGKKLLFTFDEFLAKYPDLSGIEMLGAHKLCAAGYRLNYKEEPILCYYDTESPGPLGGFSLTRADAAFLSSYTLSPIDGHPDAQMATQNETGSITGAVYERDGLSLFIYNGQRFVSSALGLSHFGSFETGEDLIALLDNIKLDSFWPALAEYYK